MQSKKWYDVYFETRTGAHLVKTVIAASALDAEIKVADLYPDAYAPEAVEKTSGPWYSRQF